VCSYVSKNATELEIGIVRHCRLALVTHVPCACDRAICGTSGRVINAYLCRCRPEFVPRMTSNRPTGRQEHLFPDKHVNREEDHKRSATPYRRPPLHIPTPYHSPKEAERRCRIARASHARSCRSRHNPKDRRMVDPFVKTLGRGTLRWRPLLIH